MAKLFIISIKIIIILKDLSVVEKKFIELVGKGKGKEIIKYIIKLAKLFIYLEALILIILYANKKKFYHKILISTKLLFSEILIIKNFQYHTLNTNIA